MAEAEGNFFTSTPLRSPKHKEKNNFISLYLLIPLFLLIVFLYVLWMFCQNSFVHIFKSITAGCLLVYYSWQLIYFDSIRPGIQPSSPLSLSSIRILSGLNYTLALLTGVFATWFVAWFL